MKRRAILQEFATLLQELGQVKFVFILKSYRLNVLTVNIRPRWWKRVHKQRITIKEQSNICSSIVGFTAISFFLLLRYVDASLSSLEEDTLRVGDERTTFRRLFRGWLQSQVLH